MAKAYIITEVKWEYNDNTYYQQGNEPVKAFRSLERAEQACLQNNIEALKAGPETFDDAFVDCVEENKQEFKALGMKITDGDYPKCYDMTDKALTRVLELVSTRWYEVTQIEIDDTAAPKKSAKGKEPKTEDRFEDLT